MVEDDIEFERICRNCSCFFQDVEDSKDSEKWDYGICMNINNDIFEPYIDEILQRGSFSSCRELYLQNRFDGLRDCSKRIFLQECIL